MKDVKYRAWDKKSKKMRYVNCIVFDGKGSFESNTQSVKLVNLWGYDIIEGKNIIVQREPKYVDLLQYTGEKDVNGREMYEGDITKSPNGNTTSKDSFIYGVITFAEGGFYKSKVGSEGDQPYPFDNGTLFKVCANDPEVIGNIYENPELLEAIY